MISAFSFPLLRTIEIFERMKSDEKPCEMRGFCVILFREFGEKMRFWRRICTPEYKRVMSEVMCLYSVLYSALSEEEEQCFQRRKSRP